MKTGGSHDPGSTVFVSCCRYRVSGCACLKGKVMLYSVQLRTGSEIVSLIRWKYAHVTYLRQCSVILDEF